jgi:hypothetical protein
MYEIVLLHGAFTRAIFYKALGGIFRPRVVCFAKLLQVNNFVE